MADCGAPVSLTREQVEGIEAYATAALSEGDAILVAAIDGGDNVVAFVRRGKTWSAYQISENGGVEALYRSDRGDVFAWTYEGRGDPPFGFSALHVPADGSDSFCTRFDVPGDLNNPDWQGEAFSFEQFNLVEDGRGAIVGSSEVERDGQIQTWTFRYDTTDGGRNWADPVRIEGGNSVAGAYSRVEEQDGGLLDEVRNSMA